jgi:Plasmid replication region DNA-binding N-term
MSAESEILAEVDALKAKFSDTRALYREVCALIFFRFGITPTANKLYQYVRRGSMNVPTEEVGKFWDELRQKARIDIEHPDLPDEVKSLAAEVIAGLWRQASDAARGELAAARLENQAEADAAREAQASAEAAARQAQVGLEQQRAELSQRDEALRSVQVDLEAERRAHAGAQARVQELLSQLDQGRIQQQRQQEGFSADLARARETVEAAQERAAAAERRALMEIEQERQARARAEKTSEGLRDRLGEAEGRERQQSLTHAEAVTRLQMELNAATAALRGAQEAREALQTEVARLVQRLFDSQQAAARHQTEAQTLQALVERLTPPPTPATADVAQAAPARAARKKAGTSGA